MPKTGTVASTVHVAPVVVTGTGTLLRDGAVAVDGDRVVAVGLRDVVRAAAPAARVREHRGVLAPGLVDARAVLEPGREREGVHALLRAGTAGAALSGASAAGLRAAASAGLRAVATAPDPAVPVLSASGDGAVPAGAVPELARLMASGAPFALGTAGAGHDLLAVARALHDVALGQGAATAELAEALLRAATTGGAAAVGLPGAGTLAVGGRADLVVLDVPTEDDPYAALVTSGGGRCTATVLAGRLVHRR